jgi:hypothetical protein
LKLSELSLFNLTFEVKQEADRSKIKTARNAVSKSKETRTGVSVSNNKVVSFHVDKQTPRLDTLKSNLTSVTVSLSLSLFISFHSPNTHTHTHTHSHYKYTHNIHSHTYTATHTHTHTYT